MIRSRCASGNAEVPANFYALSPSTPQPAPQAPTSRSPDIDHDRRSSTPIAEPTSPHRTRHRISRNGHHRDTFTRDTFPTADCQQPSMESPDQEQHSSPERPFCEMPERVLSQPDTDSPARHREGNRMLLHYIELISEYQDTRRSEDVGAPSSDTPQQDTPDMPPPPELVQSIKSAGDDLPACDAVIVQNLQALSQQTGRDAILYAGAFRHRDRGLSPATPSSTKTTSPPRRHSQRAQPAGRVPRPEPELPPPASWSPHQGAVQHHTAEGSPVPTGRQSSVGPDPAQPRRHPAGHPSYRQSRQRPL